MSGRPMSSRIGVVVRELGLLGPLGGRADRDGGKSHHRGRVVTPALCASDWSSSTGRIFLPRLFVGPARCHCQPSKSSLVYDTAWPAKAGPLVNRVTCAHGRLGHWSRGTVLALRTASAVKAAVERAMAETTPRRHRVLRGEGWQRARWSSTAGSYGPRALQRLKGLAQKRLFWSPRSPSRRGDRHGYPAALICCGLGETEQADHPRPARGGAGVTIHVAARGSKIRSAATSRCVRLPRGRSPATRLPDLPRPRSGSPSFPACCPPWWWVRSARASRQQAGASGRASRTCVHVDAADARLHYEETGVAHLQQVAQARVPPEGAENTRYPRVAAERRRQRSISPSSWAKIRPTERVLIRLRSSVSPATCWARCAAIAACSCAAPSPRSLKQGSGFLLYLAGGGRGLGLGQQAARLRIAGRRLRHDRRQRAARLRCRRAHLRPKPPR